MERFRTAPARTETGSSFQKTSFSEAEAYGKAKTTYGAETKEMRSIWCFDINRLIPFIYLIPTGLPDWQVHNKYLNVHITLVTSYSIPFCLTSALTIIFTEAENIN